VHLLFNISGILVIYPIKRIRLIPVRLAQGLAARTAEKKIYALLYMLGVFFVLPLVFVLIDKLIRGI
jgi:sodium-dependent phosphate cotransporter